MVQKFHLDKKYQVIIAAIHDWVREVERCIELATIFFDSQAKLKAYFRKC